MKKTFFHKLTALVLAFAMALSMAGTAFAAELSQDADSSSAVLPAEDEAASLEDAEDQSEPEDTDSTDTNETDPADDSASDSSTEAASSTPAAADPADTETDPADASSATDSSGNADEEVIVPQSEDQLGWVLLSETTTSSTGEETVSTHYEFHYKDASNNVVSLKSGYYSLPEETVTDETTQQTVTYQAGIYYFDENGKLTMSSSSMMTATKANKSTAAYVLGTTTSYKTAYKTVTASNGNYTVSSSTTSKILALNDAYTSAYAAGSTVEIDPTVAAVYILHSGCVAIARQLWCINGELYSGFWRCMDNTTANSDAGYDTKLYYIKNGTAKTYKGKMDAASAKKLGITAQYYCNGEKQSALDGKVYLKGVYYTGLFISAYAGNPDYGYYTAGVLKSSLNGWWYYNSSTKKWSRTPFQTKINKKTQVTGVINTVYYFKKGYVLRSKENVKLSSMDGSGTKYYYTFRANGQLVTNMFSYKSAYRKKKLKIVVSRSNHTCTIFAYNSKTKKYDIPCKSFVVATAKKTQNYKVGTYKLGSQKAWMNDQQATGKPLPKCSWYRYATHIKGASALFHSSNYWPNGYTHGSINQMKGHLYNQLGTNVTAACVRCQLVNCKLIYNLRKINKKIKVELGYSNTNDAFGTMTLQYNFDQTGGTVSGGTKKSVDCTTDPTEKLAIW